MTQRELALAVAAFVVTRLVRALAPAARAALPWIALAVPLALAVGIAAMQGGDLEIAAGVGLLAGSSAIAGKSALAPLLRRTLPAGLAQRAIDALFGGERP